MLPGILVAGGGMTFRALESAGFAGLEISRPAVSTCGVVAGAGLLKLGGKANPDALIVLPVCGFITAWLLPDSIPAIGITIDESDISGIGIKAASSAAIPAPPTPKFAERPLFEGIAGGVIRGSGPSPICTTTLETCPRTAGSIVLLICPRRGNSWSCSGGTWIMYSTPPRSSGFQPYVMPPAASNDNSVVIPPIVSSLNNDSSQPKSIRLIVPTGSWKERNHQAGLNYSIKDR